MSSNVRRTVTLAECAAFQEGYVNPSQRDPSYFGNDVKWLRATDLNDGFVFTTGRGLSRKGFESAGKSALLFEPGTLAISKSGTIGRIGILKDYMCGNRAVINIKVKPGCDTRFIFYTLLLSRREIETLAEGSVQKNLYCSSLGRLKFELPPLDEQRRISEIAGALDDRITLLRETSATLEAIAQALFKSWFVDFDPVRANIAAKSATGGAAQGGASAAQGTTAGMPEAGQRRKPLPPMPAAALDAATAALFPDSFEESELGLVPRGWKVKPVGDAVQCLGGGTPDTKEPSYWDPAEHCWTTPKDLSGLQSPVLLRTERQLSTLGLAKISSGLLPAGTLLLSSRAPIGYLAIAQMPVAVNQGYIAIPRGGELSPLYMLFWCRQNMEAIKGRANGSTFMEISKKAFRPIPALVPSAEVLDAFGDIAEPLFERLVENERQAQTLTQLRDTLLPRLICGQLRLPESC